MSPILGVGGAEGWMAKTKLRLVEEILEKDHKRLTTRELRENLAEAVNYASRNRGALVLTNNGVDRVAIVSIEDLRLLEILSDLEIKEALNGDFDQISFLAALHNKLNEIGKARDDAREEAEQFLDSA
jgi:hypothetical protein